jgi:hypothetical protein
MYGTDQCDEIIRLIDDVLNDNRAGNEPVAHMERPNVAVDHEPLQPTITLP